MEADHTGRIVCPHEGCNKSYKFQTGMENHLYRVHGQGEGRKSKDAAEDKLRRDENVRFICPHEDCGKEYKFQTGLDNHLFKVHQEGDAGKKKVAGVKGGGPEDDLDKKDDHPFRCPHDDCERGFKFQSGLDNHLYKIHGEGMLNKRRKAIAEGQPLDELPDPTDPPRYACQHPGCDRVYKFTTGLTNHLYKAHGEEPPSKKPKLDDDLREATLPSSSSGANVPVDLAGTRGPGANGRMGGAHVHVTDTVPSLKPAVGEHKSPLVGDVGMHDKDDKVSDDQTRYYCPDNGCQRCFRFPTGLANHLHLHHKFDPKKAEMTANEAVPFPAPSLKDNL